MSWRYPSFFPSPRHMLPTPLNIGGQAASKRKNNNKIVNFFWFFALFWSSQNGKTALLCSKIVFKQGGHLAPMQRFLLLPSRGALNQCWTPDSAKQWSSQKVTSSRSQYERLLLKHAKILIQILDNQHKISVWYGLLLSKNAVGYVVLLTEHVTPRTLPQTYTPKWKYLEIKYVFAYTLEVKELFPIQWQ